MHSPHPSPLVNDIHSALNATRVAAIHQPRSLAGIRALIADAAERKLPVAICGGRHAMGGQQFAADAILLDMRHMRRVLAFDAAAGLVEAEAGIEWPELIDYLDTAPTPHGGQRWSIRQKQTGCPWAAACPPTSTGAACRCAPSSMTSKPLLWSMRKAVCKPAAAPAIPSCSHW